MIPDDEESRKRTIDELYSSSGEEEEEEIAVYGASEDEGEGEEEADEEIEAQPYYEPEDEQEATSEEEVEDNHVSQQDKYFPKNYALMYNNEAIEFFIGLPPDFMDSNLQGSHVNINGTKEPQRRHARFMHHLTDDDEIDESDENESPGGPKRVGTYWTAREKELFFIFLGRKSRHNLEAVAEAIGTKSLVEVEEYHDIVFAASQQCSVAHHVSIDDVPAAREMSEYWIEMEEVNSESMGRYECVKEQIYHNMLKTRANKLNPIGALKPEDEYLQNVRVWNPLANPVYNAKDTFEDEKHNTESLIDVVKAIKMSNRLFWSARYDMLPSELKTRQPLRYLTREYIGKLEALVRERVRKIMAKSRMIAMRRIHSYNKQKDFVTKKDVKLAIEQLEYPTSYREYFRFLAGRVNLNVRYANNVILKPDVVEKKLGPRYFKRRKLDNGTAVQVREIGAQDQAYSDSDSDEFAHSDLDEEYDFGDKEQEEELDIASERVDSEEESDSELEHEQSLINAENEALEHSDQIVSVAEERILVRWLTTYDNPTLLSQDQIKSLVKLRGIKKQLAAMDDEKFLNQVTNEADKGESEEERIAYEQNIAEEPAFSQKEFERFLKTPDSSGFTINAK